MCRGIAPHILNLGVAGVVSFTPQWLHPGRKYPPTPWISLRVAYGTGLEAALWMTFNITKSTSFSLDVDFSWKFKVKSTARCRVKKSL